VALAARSSGIKDAMIVPILNLITAKGKELCSKKVSDVNTSGDMGQEMPMQDDSNLAQIIPDSMDVDESRVNTTAPALASETAYITAFVHFPLSRPTLLSLCSVEPR
jgi:hypothetical protein